MSSALLNRNDNIRQSAFTDPAEVVATYFDRSPGFCTPVEDAWGRRFQQIKTIEATHKKYDDAETPLIPSGIIQGTRRLIRQLEYRGMQPPTCMNGTVDATICLEWHDPPGDERFVSIDVLDFDKYEIFTRYHDKTSTIEVVTF